MNRPDSHDSTDSGVCRKEMNVLAMAKEGQRFVFFWDDATESRDKLREVFAKFTDNPDMPFTKEDEALLSRKAEEREQRYLPKDAA